MAKRTKKTELQKLFESNATEYETTIEDCHKWFRILNREVFGNQLEAPDAFDIRWRRKTYAYHHVIYEDDPKKPPYSYTKICMNKRYKSKQFFVEVLAHELVHHYQYLNGQYDDGEDGHGASFMKWNDVFKKKGLRLQKAYDNEED